MRLSISHCGKLGDFIMAFPVLSWLYRTHREKITILLPSCFDPFTKIESLLHLQSFTGEVILIDHPVTHWEYGGQPYHIDHTKYTSSTIHYSFGFNGALDDVYRRIFAREYGLGVDDTFVLNLGDYDKGDYVFCTEQLSSSFPEARSIDFSQDVLYNARLAAGAKEIHCWYSGLAVILDMANIHINVYGEDAFTRGKTLMMRGGTRIVE